MKFRSPSYSLPSEYFAPLGRFIDCRIYNGGTLDPNPAYAESVREIAEHLRRMVLNAVALESVASKPARVGR